MVPSPLAQHRNNYESNNTFLVHNLWSAGELSCMGTVVRAIACLLDGGGDNSSVELNLKIPVPKEHLDPSSNGQVENTEVWKPKYRSEKKTLLSLFT